MSEKSFFEIENRERSFKTPIGEITVPGERNLFNAVRNKYKKLAKDSLEEFKKHYKKYKSCMDILNSAPDDFKASISNIVDDIRAFLIDTGEYDWDDETVYNYLSENDYDIEFCNFLGSLYEKVTVINQDVEFQREFREERKNNRGRWVGATIGGNSIDAVSHQMNIGAMNLASGAAHGIINAAGNIMTEIQAASDLESLFNSEETMKGLLESVYVSSFSMMFAFIELVGKDYDWAIVESGDSDKAQRLINNLCGGKISEEQVPEICKKVLSLDPYNIGVYTFLFDKYGDDGTLGELAEYFGVDEFIVYKDECATEYVKKLQGKTEEDAIAAKEKLIKYCKKIKLKDDGELQCVKYIDSRIKKFDLDYRTVDGFVCKTREGADYSRKELPEITEFMKEITAPGENPLLPYEKKLLAKKEEFKKRFKSEVTEKYLQLIDGYLTEFDDTFCSTRMFKKVSRKQAAQDRALRYAKGLKFSNPDEFEAAYQKYKKFIESNLGITIDEAVEAKAYLEKKRARLQYSISGAIKGLLGKFQ